MKLYIWKEVLCDYTCGIAFAMANSLEEAKQVIRDSVDEYYCVDDTVFYKEPEVYEIPYGFAIWGGG